MEYAEELGMTIKLLGTSRKIGDDSFYAMVAPFLVGQTSPLYSVNDVFNAVFVMAMCLVMQCSMEAVQANFRLQVQ